MALAMPSSAFCSVSTSPPAVVIPPPAEQVRPVMVVWTAGDVQCKGQPVAAVDLRRPYIAMTYGSAQLRPLKPVTLQFRIDATGRPLSIAQDGTESLAFASDLGPSLVISRFAAGSERTGCRITYTAQQTGIAETSVEDLVSYSLAPQSGRLPREGWERIKPAGSTCYDAPVPARLNIAYPDFPRLVATPGVRDWTMVHYDLDDQGQPVNIRTAYSTRNPGLNAASEQAVKASRYAQGPRKGCMFPYWRAPDPVEAPPSPAEIDYVPAGSTCTQRGSWAKKPVLLYPPAYRKHAVEGWAIVAFDVAPWGATGNVRTLVAEPAADFGLQAERVIRSATTQPSASGKTGCVELVRFVMDGPAVGTEKPAAGDEPEVSFQP